MKNEIRFVKFGSLEAKAKKYISKKCHGIKDSDLVCIELDRIPHKYIVTLIGDELIEIKSVSGKFDLYVDIDDKVLNALDNISDFTIYVPVTIKKEVIEEEEPKAVPDDFEKIEITHKCGHKEIVKVPKEDDIFERLCAISAEETKLCPNCWKEEVKEKAREAKEAGLPPLKGSEKQKERAEIIRAEMLEMFRADPAAGELYTWYAENYTKASEWIEAKSKNWYELKRSMEEKTQLAKIKARLAARRVR